MKYLIVVFVILFQLPEFITAGEENDSAPSLGDLDGDNDLDMLVGNRQGLVYFYRNNGSVGSPNFQLVSNNYAGINVFFNSTPAIVDINNDSDKDLFVGNIKGGMYYYENWDVFGINKISSEIPARFGLLQNYPNPFNPRTSFGFRIADPGFVTIKIFNASGQEISTIVSEILRPGTYEADWDASNFPSGVYFYQLTVSSEQSTVFKETRKMVLVK